MPLADGAGGTTKKGGRKPIVVFNPAQSTTTTVVNQPASSGGGRSKPLGAPKTGSAGKSSGSSSASSSASSAATDYAQQQRARDNAARDRYIEDAENLSGQVDALRAALGPKGTFRDALRSRLQNIKLVRNEQMDILEKGFGERSASLDLDQSNNRTAAADSSNLNEMNRLREQSAAIAEAMSMGAGESDTARAQIMSLRNWDANQDGINRAFHDGQRSIANSRVDLQIDTRTGLNNIWSEANADREQMWTNYYNQTSESQTQLGNTLGQQAEYYGLAREAARNAGSSGVLGGSSSASASAKTKQGKGGGKGGGKGQLGKGGRGGGRSLLGASSSASAEFEGREGPVNLLGVGGPDTGRPDTTQTGRGTRVPRDWDKGKDLGRGGKGRGKGPGNNRPNGGGRLGTRQDDAAKQSDKAFMQATKTLGKVWDRPETPTWLKEWGEAPAAPEMMANSSMAMGRSTTELKRPEGATLRKW